MNKAFLFHNITVLLYITLLVLIITPLTPIFLDVIMPLNESRPRFFVIEVEFRVNKDEYFLPIFCYISALAIVSINITVGVDTMHIACTSHACSLFAAVSKQMENIISKVDNNNDTSENKHGMNEELEEMIYWKYIICLKKHQLAIKFVDILNASYQVYALTFLIIVIGTMSVIGLRILYILDQLETVIKFVLILMVSLSSLLITCYSGQRIMDESQKIFYGAYAAEWYEFSPRLKSLLIITLYRSSTPCELKAGNMISLSIATYAMVVRMSMSYYTALLSIQD
ncbi:odorant receptor 2a-like [Temnothorax nylanderi]|uniref:odorant receptor 2a-like n=1 Tax=Temnothorax nylanderi TaxID=102681 RepID=UPI003A85C813